MNGVKSKNGSSLKGHKFNKVYLHHDQGTYYDTDDPSILLIPLLDLQDVMNWATDEAHAIDYNVMAVTLAISQCRPHPTSLRLHLMNAHLRKLSLVDKIWRLFSRD